MHRDPSQSAGEGPAGAASGGRAPRGGFVGFLIRMAIAAVGLWLAAEFVGGVSIEGDRPLVLSALVLGVVNAGPWRGDFKVGI